MAEKYYFSTRDLLTIAILSCLGAVLSTYVGYIGSTFGSLTGIPFGGQLLSGLHIFWLILVLVLVDKKGAGFTAALLDNIVQFIMGSHLGILVVLVGALQGIFAELGYWPFKKYSKVMALVIAGGLSSWSNLLVTQTLFNKFGGLYLFGAVSIFAVISGIIFGGCLTYIIVKILSDAGIAGKKEEKSKGLKGDAIKIGIVLAVSILLILITATYVIPAQTNTNKAVTNGNVTMIELCDGSGFSKKYDVSAYKNNYVTITASFKGTESSYTGLPVNYLLKDSGLDKKGNSVKMIASDNYAQSFDMKDLTDGNNVIIVPVNGSYNIVAKGFQSNTWVRNLVTIKVS